MQIQENINAANFLSVGMSTSKKGTADESSAEYDFASFLNTSDTNKDNSVGGVSPEKELFPQKNSNEVKAQKTDNSSSNQKKISNAEKKKDNNLDSNSIKATSKDNVSQTLNNANNVEVDSTVEGEELEQALEVLSDIVQMIIDQFDITMEDIEVSLDQIGMELGELVTDEGAKAFFLDIQSADVSDILTDEALGNELQNFMAEIKEIVDEEGIIPESILETAHEEAIKISDVEAFNESVVMGANVKESDIPEDVVTRDYGEEVTIVEDSEDVIRQPEVSVNVEGETNNSNSDKSDTKETSSEKKSTSIHSDNKNDITNTVLQNLNDAVTQVEDVTPTAETNVRPANIVEQIVEQVRVNINQENTSMEMQLYPEHLGRIQIHVVSKDGVMTARIAAETETARQAIEAGLNNLKESLQNQNLKVDAIEVMVSTTGFAESDQNREQYQQQGTGKRNGRLGFTDIEDEIPEDEAETQKMQAEGSSVSYRA